jgi:hypothetical protein
MWILDILEGYYLLLQDEIGVNVMSGDTHVAKFLNGCPHIGSETNTGIKILQLGAQLLLHLLKVIDTLIKNCVTSKVGCIDSIHCSK